MKMILPIQEEPSISTCIHHAYPCAIIESLNLAQIEISRYSKSIWSSALYGTNFESEGDFVSVYAEEEADTQDWVIWRECSEIDEMILYIKYLKPKDLSRCVDIFLFSDDYETEFVSQDKSCGFRWNPYGFFYKKEMFFYDTKLYKYMKVNVVNSHLIGYASKDGIEWEKLAEIAIPDRYRGTSCKIGIHARFGENFYEIWKNMNFVQLLYNKENEWKGIYLDYFFFPRKNVDNGYGCYSAFLETHYNTLYDVLDLFDSIHEYIHWEIRHYYYPEICLDEFYVPNRAQFGNNHFNHYNLFYGFDDQKQVYYVMGYGDRQKPIVSEIPYAVFENKSVITSEKIIEFKYAANDVTNLKFSIEALKCAVNEFLNGVDSAEKFSNLLTQEAVFYGLDVFKILALEEPKRIYYDMRIAFCILEHSKLMKGRLNYLKKKGYLLNDEYEKLETQSNQIVKKATIIMNLVLKGIMSDREYPLVSTYLLELYELERKFLVALLTFLNREYN